MAKNVVSIQNVVTVHNQVIPNSVVAAVFGRHQLCELTNEYQTKDLANKSREACLLGFNVFVLLLAQLLSFINMGYALLDGDLHRACQFMLRLNGIFVPSMVVLYVFLAWLDVILNGGKDDGW